MSTCISHSNCLNSALAAAESYCARSNLRFTDIRRRVFELIWQSHKAVTAPEVMSLLNNNQPPITYRALEFLHGNGLIHHVTSLNAYIGCPHVGHSHTSQLLICTTCRDIIEIHQSIPQLHSAAENKGFHISRMQVEVLGTCRTCQPPAN